MTLNGVAVTGNQAKVAPSATKSYTLAATNGSGTVTSMVTVTVNDEGTLSWKRDIVYLGLKEVGEFDAAGMHVAHLDHLGTPRLMTGPSGQEEGRPKHTPFGETLDQGAFAKGFTNHEQTDLSGLIYMQARFYAPGYGRFLSPDPARDQHFEQTQSWNIYSYVQNNPVMSADPTGMLTFRDLYDNTRFKNRRGSSDPSDPDFWNSSSAQTKKEDSAQTNNADGSTSKNALVVTDGGSKANLQKRADLAASAIVDANNHDTSWTYDKTRDAGTCSKYVNDKIVSNGMEDPSVKKADGRFAPPGAAEWAGSKVPGWRIMKAGEMPQPGDVGAVKMNPTQYHGATGHVVIVVSTDKGRIDVVAAHPRGIGYERGVSYEGVTWRRYTGE